MTTDYNILGRHSTWVVSKTMQCWCRKPILRAMRIFDEHQLRLWFWLWTQKDSCTEWDWEPQDQISNSLAHTVSGYHFNNMSLWTNYLCDHEVISVIWSWYDYDRSWMTYVFTFFVLLQCLQSYRPWIFDCQTYDHLTSARTTDTLSPQDSDWVGHWCQVCSTHQCSYLAKL